MDFKSFVRETEPKGWLVDSLVPCGHKVLVAGKPGACKSWFTEALAIAVASGTPFLGLDVKPGGVVLFDEDTPEDDLKGRLGMLNKGAGAENPRLEVVSMQGTALDSPTSVQRVEEYIRTEKPVLVVFDVLGKMLSHLDINRPKDMAVFNSTLDSMRAICDSTIVISHHMGKKNSHDYVTLVMGSTGIVGNSDTAFGISAIDTHRVGETTFAVRPIARKLKLKFSTFRVRLVEGNDWVRLERLGIWIPELEADADLIRQVIQLFKYDPESKTVRDVHNKLGGLACEEGVRSVLKILSQPNWPLILHTEQHNRFRYTLRDNWEDSMPEELQAILDGNKEGETEESKKLGDDSGTPDF